MGSLLSLLLPAALSGHSKATQTEWNCPVCHAVHSDTAAVPCGHRFCLGCLLRHSATSATCPQCSSPVLSARFSVGGSNDFLQCILTPGGAPPGPRSWARKALFHLVYTRSRPAPPAAAPSRPEPLCPEPTEGLPAELWAELLLGHEHLLDPVRPWLRQSLDAIYGPQWWEARQVESIALSTLCICGPDRDGLTRMLQGYLGEYTAPLIHGLIRVTVQHCRDAWLQWRNRAALQEDGEQRESPTASAGPGLGNQPSEPEPAWPAGPGRALALPAPAGQNQPWVWPDEHQRQAGAEQNQLWVWPDEHQPQAGAEQNQLWVWPDQHQRQAGAEQNQPWVWPDEHQPQAGAEQNQPWVWPDQHQPRAGPQENSPAPGPSVPRRRRNCRPRPRASRRCPRRRDYKSCRPLMVRRRNPRRK